MEWTGHFGQGIQPVWTEFGGDVLVEDKLPMLVPPTATKAPFYRNQLLAEQWVQAGGALGEAEELVLMGYSAPTTDLTVSSLIATRFRGNAIVPVNRNHGVIERAKAIGDRRNPPTVIEDYVAADAMAKWTTDFTS